MLFPRQPQPLDVQAQNFDSRVHIVRGNAARCACRGVGFDPPSEIHTGQRRQRGQYPGSRPSGSVLPPFAWPQLMFFFTDGKYCSAPPDFFVTPRQQAVMLAASRDPDFPRSGSLCGITCSICVRDAAGPAGRIPTEPMLKLEQCIAELAVGFAGLMTAESLPTRVVPLHFEVIRQTAGGAVQHTDAFHADFPMRLSTLRRLISTSALSRPGSSGESSSSSRLRLRASSDSPRPSLTNRI